MEQTIKENWELDTLYAGGKDSKKLHETLNQLKREIDRLHTKIGTVDDQLSFASCLRDVQKNLKGLRELEDYIVCLYAVNVGEPDILKIMNEIDHVRSMFEALFVDIDTHIDHFSVDQWNHFIQLQEVQDVRFYLEERRAGIKDRLPAEMEKLINKLAINGFIGWENYYEQLMGELKILIDKQGKVEEASIGQALMYLASPNRSLRKNTAEALMDVLQQNGSSFATTFNRISGFRLDVYEKRGWDNMLKEAMDKNRMKEKTLHTMLSAIRAKSYIMQPYLKRKAQLMKLKKMAWYDTDVPSFTSKNKITYAEAADLIITQFSKFSEKLGTFAANAFANGWIEAEDRKGKMHGGFCAYLPIAKESRIFLTYTGSYQDVVTIAHELGHAYHNYLVNDQPAFAQERSTSIAETASTFAENLVLDAVIDSASNEEEKLTLLEMKIGNGLKYQVTVPAMFDFEMKLYEQRKSGPLKPNEINELMTSTFKQVYGDTVKDMNPYLWMTIPHLYRTELPFYNFPYTIGYLLSNVMYAQYKENPVQFPAQYDAFLKNTGKMTIEQLAAHYLKQDITDLSFWEASLQPTIEAIEQYKKLSERKWQEMR
ncbi:MULTISPECIES: M3 family oligoendopeptidase [unclassified Virgibacillus]|uniref:M3 family oligoendopeptidase n=1 Tax=unclassified Virgibacillus TaxID=2620237 RepID=UPI000EF4FCAF|nr:MULTISPECIES: M3 family oligoendopeptidase [unclassified Virgibacillus]MDY7045570.1 M3 family oligoendopeptidase [Virgibacillus sp. M23]